MTISGRGQINTGDLKEHRFLVEQGWNTIDFFLDIKIYYQANTLESLCAGWHLDFPNQVIELPSTPPLFKVPEILVHCTSTRLAKIWEIHKWIEVIKYCRSKWYNEIVGTIPKCSESTIPRSHIRRRTIEDL